MTIQDVIDANGVRVPASQASSVASVAFIPVVRDDEDDGTVTATGADISEVSGFHVSAFFATHTSNLARSRSQIYKSLPRTGD